MKTARYLGVMMTVAIIGIMARSRWAHEQEASDPGIVPIPVKIGIAERREIVHYLPVTGTLMGQNEATVVSETSGKIVEVKTRIGDWLEKDQVILQVENDLKAVALEQAKAHVLAAQTNRDKARKDLARYEELYAERIATQNDIENIRLAARAAEAQQISAEAALRLAQRQYDDTAVKAPIEGRLADRYVNEGTMLAPGQEIGIVVDSRNMKLRAGLTESEVALVRPGQPVELTADVLPQARFHGQVVSVAHKADNERTYPVEIQVENDPEESLMSGMFGRAAIQVARIADALVVPSTAVLSGAAQDTYVFVEENGIAKRVPVNLGAGQNSRVQITSGLPDGARVVVSGAERLSEGAPVLVLN